MKNTLWMSILLALLVSGCSQEEMLKHTSSASGGRVFTTSFENDESRTYLEDGKYSRWTEGDRISLFDASTLNNQYLFAGDTGDSGGTFFMLSKPEGMGTTLATNYAVYPYDKDMTISSKGTITLTLPSIQHYAENSYGLGDNTMVAVTENTDDTFLSFKNVGGCFKLQLYGDDVTVKSITLKGNNDEKIAGKATITAAYDKAPVVTMAVDAATSITLDCGKGIKMGTTEDEATTFWIVVPPTIFSKGITVMVRDFGNKVFSQSTDKELVIERNVVKPMAPVKAVMIEDNTGSSADSVYYCTDMDGFELVSATKDGQAFYMQTDATFAFKCMYDFGKRQNLVAYCDSTGTVERIVTEDKVINILYHEDLSKIDIFFEKDGKLEWLRDLENPYQEMSSRAIEGDVPYSAISVQNRLSHAVYKIINEHPLGIGEKLWGYLKKFGIPAYNSQLRMEFMVNMLSETFSKDYIENHYKTIQTVMNDYAVWVMNEMYGNAMPVVHNWVERTINDTIKIDCHVNDVDPSKTDFRIGMRIESGTIVQMPYFKHDKCDKNAPKPELVHIKCTMYATGDKNFLEYTCLPLPAGRKYKFRAFLVPSASSKYLTNMKCILDYSRWGSADEFYLFDPKATVLSEGEDKVKVKLSTVVDNFHQNFTMGVYYGTDPAISKTEKWEIEKLNNLEHQTQEVEISSIVDGTDGEIVKELTLEGLEPGVTYYYKPYIQYSGNISNKPVANYLETIFPEDRIFYGEGGTIDPLREALIKLYQTTNGDNWKRKDNWCSDKPVTEWYGVTFSNIDSTYLVSLIGNNLTGRIEQVFPKDYKIELRCSNNQLVFIDVSKSTSLIRLDCDNNLLTSLNVSDCTNLENIVLSYNQLNEFRHSGCKALNEVIMNESFAKQTATRSANQQASLDFSDSPVLYTLDCDGNQLASLEVSNCTALHHLSCSNNQLTSLDLSNCNLFRLDCDKNKLLSLDLSSCTNLYYLDCNHNRSMTSLNIANCTGLYDFMCCDNKLTSLDLSNFTKLERLYCFSGSLISLNVSGCVALAELYCHDNQLTYLDVSGCTVLSELLCAKNQLSSLDVSSCIALSHLDCESNLLTNLHVSNNEVLYLLDCSYNQLASLDVSNHKVLEVLRCYNNRLTSLDVDGCTALESLSCEENKITRFIPDWFSQLDYFSYDKRFEYWRDYIDGSTYEIKHKDKGIGWSYKDEPNAKYSGF